MRTHVSSWVIALFAVFCCGLSVGAGKYMEAGLWFVMVVNNLHIGILKKELAAHKEMRE